MRYRAYSLVEFLVVVAIVSLLATAAVTIRPSPIRARDRAASLLRQSIRATRSYAIRNNTVAEIDYSNIQFGKHVTIERQRWQDIEAKFNPSGSIIQILYGHWVRVGPDDYNWEEYDTPREVPAYGKMEYRVHDDRLSGYVPVKVSNATGIVKVGGVVE